MTKLIRSYAEFLIRIRVWVILAVIMITVFLGMQIAKLKIDMNQDIWAPQTHPYVKATKVLEETLVGTDLTLIGIVPKEGDIFQPDILAKIKRIQHGIEEIPEAVKHNVISLAARKVKDIRGTEEGMEVRPMLESIPQLPEEIDRLKKAIFSNPIYINSLVSPDGQAAAVIADFRVNKENPVYTTLYGDIRKVVDKERDGSVEIYMGGIPIVLNGIEFYMLKMPLYFAIALLIIILIQYWSFRTFQGMLLPIATALISVVWGLGFMGLTGVHMDAMGANSPILIMAVAAGHAIQILKRYYEEYCRLTENNPHALSARAISHVAVVESLVKVGPVMITAGLIAAITFYSLTVSEISVVRHFGFFAGSGIIAALILEMTFIPSLRMLLPPPMASETEREKQTGIMDQLLCTLADNLVGGRAPWILAIIFALVAVAFIGVARLQTDNSLTRYFAKDSDIRNDDTKLNSLFGGTNSIFFLVEGQRQDSLKDPKVLQGIAALQDLLAQEPQVGKTQSIVDMIKRMNQAMHGDDPAYYVIPENRDLIAQYLLLYSISGDPHDLDNFIDNDYQKGAIWVYVKDDSTAYAEELYRRAKVVIDKKFPAEVTVKMGGGLSLTSAINEVLTHEKIKNMVQMALIVFLLSSIALRSFVGGLFVATPLVMIILANFGIMGWLGVPLDMGTAITASMAIGIGADYEIYLLFRFREELSKTGDILAATRSSLLTSGKAILFVAMSVAGGYSVLLTSGFGFYTRLAIMVIATMLCSAVSALLFLRSMMMIFKPRFVFENKRDNPLMSMVKEIDK